MTLDTNTAIAPVTSALDSLVGTGKKYQTPEDLAKSRVEADLFIEKLKAEKRELEVIALAQDAELKTLKNKSSILDRLNTNTTDTTTQTVIQQPVQQVVGLSADDVIKVVRQEKAQESAQRNKLEVDSVLAKQFGAEAGAFLLQSAAALGVAPEELRDIGMKSPKALYNMLGINPNSSSSGTTYTGGTRLPVQNSEPVRNEAFYKAKQKEMGNLKFVTNKQVQIQMHRDMKALGDEFFATA